MMVVWNNYVNSNTACKFSDLDRLKPYVSFFVFASKEAHEDTETALLQLNTGASLFSAIKRSRLQSHMHSVGQL